MVAPEGPRETILSVGHQIMIGDTISTGEKTFLKIKIVDDSTIVLGPASSMKFQQLDFPSKEKKTAIYQFIKGQFQGNFTNDSTVPDAIKIHSKYVSMGIRGTIVLANAHNLPSGQRVEEVALIKGKVQLSGSITQGLLPAEHVIAVFDPAGKLQQQEQVAINAGEMQNFLTEISEAADSDRFGPLLDLYQYREKTGTGGSTRGGNLHDHQPPAAPATDTKAATGHRSADRPPASTWKNTLQNLNSQLHN